MSQPASSRNATLLTFLAGAVAGALVVALTSSRGAARSRARIAGLGRGVKDRFGRWTRRGGRVWEALQDPPEDPHPASGQDLRGKAAGVWQDAKDRSAGLDGETLPPVDPASIQG